MEPVTKSISINAPAEKVWHALTDKESIRQYMFGTETTCDWQKGSKITFSGSYEGFEYQDGGEILDIEPNKKMVYSYWSSMSGVEDIPENYARITYTLEEKDGVTELTVEQADSPTESMHENSAKHWPMTLQKIKEVVEC